MNLTEGLTLLHATQDSLENTQRKIKQQICKHIRKLKGIVSKLWHAAAATQRKRNVILTLKNGK